MRKLKSITKVMDKICLIILCALILSVKCQESIDNDNEIDNHTPIQEVPNDVEQFEVLSPNNGTIGYEYQHHSHLDDGDDNEDQSGLFSEPIVGETILRLSESPYTITNDIQIRRGAKLIIEPGVTLQFAPMIGITVRGAIEAIGTSEQKITFTSLTSSDGSDSRKEQTQIGARLVDGPTPLRGRLQIYINGKWRSVCTNSRNWTIPDYETVCRQMGYQGGRFWNWVERISYFEPRLLYEEPLCRGTESNIFECAWHTRQLGSGACDYHNDIGVQCLPLHEHSLPNWRGLLFDEAPTERVLASDNIVYDAISLSRLEHVDILRAGSGRMREMTSAIEVIGNPPVLNKVTIDHSAYTGINITRPSAAFKMNDVTVRRSNGYGVYVNSSHGLALMEGLSISENTADGIRYTSHDLRSDERTDRNLIYDFCTLPTTTSQTYPISVSLVQSQFSNSIKDCGKYFFTKPGYVLTVNFVHFMVQKNETAQIQVFDGTSVHDRLLASWDIKNFTRPQSVSSHREKIYVRFFAETRSEVLGYLRLSTGPFKTYDLNVTNSVIADNGGRGIAIDNMRSKLHVHKSSISHNGHIAGVHVLNGAGDLNITDSQISFNEGGGVNITYFGGNRNISRSSISSNTGYGFSVWLNHTTDVTHHEFTFFNQTTVVEYSNIVQNLETGVFHGNFCGNAWVNITGNMFTNSTSNSIEIQPCWFDHQNDTKLKLQIGHNNFLNDNKIAILLSPILNMDGKIEFNHFKHGELGAIYVHNKAKYEEFTNLPVALRIQHNHFYRNKGIFVVSLSVSPYSVKTVQWILFTRNFVRENKIQEPFGPQGDGDEKEGFDGEGRLNPRSRVAAPIVIGSSNVDVYRNIISNSESKYEVGSQLSDQSQVLNVTYNWLGYSDEEKIFNRLFHRKDRYDLAKIEYIPYLLHSSNPGATIIFINPTFVPRFNVDGSDRVGGEVDGQEILKAGTYKVDRDINVRPGGKLIIEPGVTLNFAPSVGMMVAGKLEARGRYPDDILFTLKREPVMVELNDTQDILNDALNLDTETEMIIAMDETPVVPVRLVGGVNEHEGRLQVFIDNKWGTVCDYGWNEINAALVCHQLGLALNPSDWRLLRSDVPNAGTTEDVILSHVRCTDYDNDITKCRAERPGEFENSCTHDNDVGIRCYEGAWAGLRFGVLSERADLQYVTVEKAGLFDYKTNSFKPALQLDFARHNFESIRVVDNLHDGLGVIYSDIYGGSINTVKNSEFSGNRGNGISLKQLGLKVHGSTIKNNMNAGINHDPVLSAIEQREIAAGFHMAPDFNIHDTDYRPFYLPEDSQDIDVDMWQMRHILTSSHVGEPIEHTINIRCQPGYVIAVQLLNPIENRSTEDIWILDSQTQNTKSDLWQLKRDLNVFPWTSSSYGIILTYNSGTNALGGTVIALSIIQAPVQNIRNRIVRGPMPTLQVSTTKIQNNRRGIMTTHYNRYFGYQGEHYLRKSNESIRIINSEISHNAEEALFIYSPFWDVHVSNISEIHIHVNNSMIRNNGRGIRQFSKDLRASNNLYHYVMQGTTVENNAFGGLELSLPYVWQYNENFTHSIYMGNGTWQRNNKFGIEIGGHYAAVNITGSTFIENNCLNGLIGFRGMEKKLKIDYNHITNNNGRYMIEFKADSLSESLGQVPGLFAFNEIRGNHYNRDASVNRAGFTRATVRGYQQYSDEPTCVIGFNGVQKVRVFRNLLSNNNVDYDLVAGVRTAHLNNTLDVMQNWWGSSDDSTILKRIFDFDDWNNHAEAQFRPYLLEDDFSGSISVSYAERQPVDLDNFGGRIFEDVTLYRKDSPYIIRQDITVMPGATLRIQQGVEMEFDRNVGILVLGTLIAQGFADNGEIVMRPIKDNSHEVNNRIERSLENLVNYDSIRLCTGRNCSTDMGSDMNEGFLEYFNHTTLQWVPICDRRFTERNAQVVCREMGYDPLDVYYGHDTRLEFHINSLTRIWSWVQPLECHGTEQRFEHCPERLNGQLYGRRHECRWYDSFVFVSCNGDAEKKPYWGGIRFANSEFEESVYDNRIHGHGQNQKPESRLEFVRIEGAGILHGEKSPAVQTIFKNPIINSVTIRNSAHHGVNLISPTNTMHLRHLNIENVLGQGINAISLTGEGRESDDSSFVPLKVLDLPYNLFSLIDICDPSKEIMFEERVLLYYKYDNNPVNCVKIFTSAYRVKPIGLRLLQSNLFNHSKEYGRPDALQLYDGDIYNITAKFVGEIQAGSTNEKNLFRTTGPILSVRLMASGAPAGHGFIAEVVTLPISAIGFNRDAQHNVSYSQISGAIGGAFVYTTAGEVSPALTLESNRIMNNCRQLYGNFSTCEAAIKMDVQNMQTIQFRNNMVKNNQGGLYIRADSRGSATSLRGYLHHNLFAANRNRPALYVEGRQSSPYQMVTLFKNYFAQNEAAYRDVIVLRQVVSNFTNNYVHSNKGGRIMEVSGFDKVRLPIYQTTSQNGFYDNVATDWRGRATIVAGTAGQHYVNNIFYNPDNDYEMITVNRSMFEFQHWNSTLDMWKTKIDAAHNFWNYNETLSVGSRIRDKADNPQLLEVQFSPFYMNNQTILDGKCPPGWSLLIDTCYMYIGAPMTFHEARDFCRSDNASLPFIRGDRTSLWLYLQRQMQYQRYTEKVWIQDLNFIDQCTSFIYTNVEIDPCNTRRPFICEIDPKVVIDPLVFSADLLTIALLVAAILAILLLCIFGVCWYAKSKHRHEQRLERRNSIRQSLRSLNNIDGQGSLRRRNFNASRSIDSLGKSTTTDYKKMTSNGSIDSMDKSVLSTDNSFTEYGSQNHYVLGDLSNQQPMHTATIKSPKYAEPNVKRSPTKVQEPKSYGLPEYNQGFELAYRNEGFRDNSTYSGTRNNSVSTNLNEDTPIIHHIETDDVGSDYYGNSSTLPLRNKNDNLAFLTDLKHRLPDYETLSNPSPTHSSFLPSPPDPPPGNSSYNRKIDRMQFSPPPPVPTPGKSEYQEPIVRRPTAVPPPTPPPNVHRPASYLTAVKGPAYSVPTSQIAASRPKTVYEAADDNTRNYSRSKSEALLETNFDVVESDPPQLTADSRSHSQPLETAM